MNVLLNAFVITCDGGWLFVRRSMFGAGILCNPSWVAFEFQVTCNSCEEKPHHRMKLS